MTPKNRINLLYKLNALRAELGPYADYASTMPERELISTILNASASLQRRINEQVVLTQRLHVGEMRFQHQKQTDETTD